MSIGNFHQNPTRYEKKLRPEEVEPVYLLAGSQYYTIL